MQIDKYLTFIHLAGVVALGAMLAAEHPSLNATLSTAGASNARHFAILIFGQQDILSNVMMGHCQTYWQMGLGFHRVKVEGCHIAFLSSMVE